MKPPESDLSKSGAPISPGTRRTSEYRHRLHELDREYLRNINRQFDAPGSQDDELEPLPETDAWERGLSDPLTGDT